MKNKCFTTPGAIHPGMVLKSDYIEAFGLTEAQTASLLDIPLCALQSLVSGKTGISTDMAARLSNAFGTGPHFWMNLQMIYDMFHAFTRH